jgi:two-component system sensor histidine kinase SenX3
MWRREKSLAERDGRELPELLLRTLSQLDGASLILAPGEIPVYANDEAENLGVLKDGRIQSEELLASIRVVRRTNLKQTGTVDIARGPIGE